MPIIVPFSTNDGFRELLRSLVVPVGTGEWGILELCGTVTLALWSMTGCQGSTGSEKTPRVTCFSTMSSPPLGHTTPGHRTGCGFRSRTRRKAGHYGCLELLHQYTVPDFGRSLRWGPPLPPKMADTCQRDWWHLQSMICPLQPAFSATVQPNDIPLSTGIPPLSRGEGPFRGGVKNRANRQVQLS